MAVSKPLAGTRIDPASVWANGNANFWPFNEGAGAGSIDATGRSNGLNTAVTRIGQYLSFNGSTSVIVCGKAKYDVQQTTKFSGIAQVITTSASRPLLIGNWQVGSSGGWAFRIDTGGGIELIVSNSNGSNYFKATATSSVLDGKPHVIGFDYRGTSSNSGIDLFVDGVKQAVTPSTFGTGNPGTLTDSGVRIGLRSDGYDQYSGKLGFVGVLFGQVLGVSGHQAIAANPWALWPDEPQLVFAPVTGVTGTSAVTITTTGTAAGAVAVAAASTQTLPLTGTSTGAVAVAGASAGTITATGSAVGAATVAGTSSQTVNLTGTATGAAAVAGASSATVDLTGTAAGTIPPLAVSGDSAVTVDLAGTAAGAVAVAGASSGTVNTTGTAAAANPVAGASSATLAFTGSAAGAVAVAGASAVTISTTGSATGEVQNFAAVSDGTFTLAGTATGTVEVAGASAQQIELGGAAAFTIRNILGSSAGRVQTSASRTEALNSADRQNTFNPARIAAGSGKRGSNVQTGKR